MNETFTRYGNYVIFVLIKRTLRLLGHCLCAFLKQIPKLIGRDDFIMIQLLAFEVPQLRNKMDDCQACLNLLSQIAIIQPIKELKNRSISQLNCYKCVQLWGTQGVYGVALFCG